MTIISVSTDDTFDNWRVKTNSIGTNIGDIGLLTTSNKTSLTSAINELNSLKATLTYVNTLVGEKNSLGTVDKTSIVNAINELNSISGGNLSSLLTSNKTGLISAINEIVTNMGDILLLSTTDKSSLVNAINELVSSINTVANATIPVIRGGTGATTASGARTNLGLGSIATQDSNAVSITGGSITAGTISGVLASTNIPAFTGDAFSTSGTTSLTLSASGATAGTYNNSTTAITPFTINAKGLVTGTGSAVTIQPNWSSIISKPTTLVGYGITDAAPLASPTFTGLVTSASNVSIGTTSAAVVSGQASDVRYLTIIGNGNKGSIQLANSIGGSLNNGNIEWYDVGNTASSSYRNAVIYSGADGSTANNKGSFIALATKQDGVSGSGGTARLTIDNTGLATFSNSIALNNGTSNLISFNSSGIGAPTFTTRSAGTKIVLYPGVSASTADYALGIAGSTMWFSTNGATDAFKWYGGTTLAATLTGAGRLTLTENLYASDIYAQRASATTQGYVFLGNSGTKYIGYDGTNIVAQGANISASGGIAVGSGNITTAAGSITATNGDIRTITAGSLISAASVYTGFNNAATGSYYFGNNATKYLTCDGTNYTFAAGGIFVNGDLTTTGTVSGSSATGFRNKIINGATDIDQRNNGAATTVDGSFVVDRWRVDFFGTGSAQRIAMSNTPEVPGFSYYIKFARTAGGTNFSSLFTKIEGVKNLSGKAMTISFWVRGDVINASGFTIWSALYDDSGTFQTYGPNNATAFSITSTWTRVSMRMDMPSVTTSLGANGGYMLLLFRCSSSTENFNISVTGVQWEEGTVATPFERRPASLELSLCQRYYEVSGTNTYLTIESGQAFAPFTAGIANTVSYKFATPKRVPPTCRVWRANGANTGLVLSSSSTVTSIASTINDLRFNAGSVGASGQTFIEFAFDASAEL